MSDGAFEADEAATPDAASKRQSSPLWIDELPFISMLVLTLGGAAYASLSPGPSLTFWQILAPVFAVFCIAAGWRRAKTKSARWRIVWTQVLHWSAILLAMRLLFLPRVEQVLDRDAFRLAIIAVMSLGTFLAAVHAASWRLCLVALLMAVAVPMIAFLQQAILAIIVAGVIAVGAFVAVIWYRRRRAAQTASTQTVA